MMAEVDLFKYNVIWYYVKHWCIHQSLADQLIYDLIVSWKFGHNCNLQNVHNRLDY